MRAIKILDDQVGVRLEWLRSFLAVKDSGSFTKAARSLYLSQPAVSTHIKELEGNLGSRLFEHVGTGIRVTRAGEAVAREARRILDGVRELKLAAAESEETVQGLISIGASTTPGNYLLPGLLSQFERDYPKAKVHFAIGNSGKILNLLRVNEIDLGVVGLEPDPAEYVSRRFVRDEVVPFVGTGHPLAKRRRVSVEDLRGHRFLVRERESATRRLFEAWLARRDLKSPVLELGCPETVKRVAAAGLGVGVLSRYAIEWERKQGRLVELKGVDLGLDRWLYTVHHRRKHLSRGIRCLLDALAAASEPG
jgi:DNA-binding transcriptional LysR family regulator